MLGGDPLLDLKMAAPVEVSIREGRKSPTVSIEIVEDTQTFEDVFVMASRSQGIVELASHVQRLEVRAPCLTHEK